jgi:hypothetical protein
MVNPIPDTVKEILGQLPSNQQVTIRTYIASLRAEIKEFEAQVLTKEDPDPHAHYHGHDLCTADHGHDDGGHEKKGHSHEEHGHKHEEPSAKGHDHGHDHKCTEDHDHGHDHKCTEDHSHGHKDHDKMEVDGDHKKEHKHGHEHKHDEHKHEHKHKHDHDHDSKKDDVPEWKKAAMDSDPSAAPFGGNWNTESSANAGKES